MGMKTFTNTIPQKQNIMRENHNFKFLSDLLSCNTYNE